MDVKLKSQLLEIADMSQVDLSQFAVKVNMDEHQQKQEMLKLQKKHAKKVDAPDVQKNDIVTVDLQSENAKFNRDGMILNVGLNLFDRDMEAQLCGLAVGAKTELLVRGCRVFVTVKRSERTVLPKIDEQFATQCGVSSLDALWDQCANVQFEEVLSDAVDEALIYMSKWLANNSRFSVEEEEHKLCCMRMYGMYTSILEGRGMTAQSATSEDLYSLFNVPTLEELDSNAKETALYILKLAVIGETLARENGSFLTEEEYDEYIRAYTESNSCDEETAKAQNPISLYACEEYSNYFFEYTEKYVFERISKLSRELSEK